MKPKTRRRLRNITIILMPFLIMAITNELVRPTIKEKPYSRFGVTAMNSADRMKNKCSWACHDDTKFCQKMHTTFMGPYFQKTDPIYYGAIGMLMSTGAYGPANILVFVVLFPLAIWFFLTRGMNLSEEIKKLKKQI